MKRFLAGTAAVIFALGLTSLVLIPYASAAGGTVYANNTQRAYDGTNISRGSNQLVVYTPAKGATTGTNSYGYEAAVVNNVVTTVANGVGNMAIPSNGYVLSGHGTARTWLQTNVTVGQTVTLDGQPPPPPPPSSATVTINGQRHDITGTNVARATNALVMYTPAKGARTGTNQYGTEVTVVDGKVTAVANSVGNAVIPSNGYVLSGHGTSATWLRTNAPIGATVVLDDPNPLPVTEKLPDVAVQTLGNFSIVTASGKKLLKFPGVTFNIGTGPLEVNATRSSSTSEDWVGKQTVYMSDGTKTVLPTTLEFYYAGDGHTHFHMRDFDAYQLFDPSGNKLREGEKHGFCFEDNTGYSSWRTNGTNGAPPNPVYTHAGSCGQSMPATTTIQHGLSVGWGDTYPVSLPDQGIDVTGLPDGNYTVVLTADQGSWIKESNESNNSATAHIKITGNTVQLLNTTGGV